MAKTSKSLVGEKFGKLTVLEQADDYISPSGYHMSRWLCECECGNRVVVLRNSLKSGSTQSCGCIRKENLIGQKFGRLTVIKQVEKPKTRSGALRYWLCKCECGSDKDVIVSTSDLKEQHTMSCGCLQKELAAKRLAEQNKKLAGSGKTNKRTKFYQEDDYAYGFTSNTNNKFYIDLDDVEFAQQYTWYENDQGYIMSRINGDLVRLHRVIVNCPDDMEVDHKTHNTLDNRKSILRVVTHSQNNMNKQSRGVIELSNGRYRAYIGVSNEKIHIGEFSNINDAILARKEAESQYFGEFSYDNSMNNVTEDVL